MNFFCFTVRKKKKNGEDKQMCSKIAEAIIGTTTPPLYSSKGGAVHGEQERNFKLVIRAHKRKEPNGHNSGKVREITTTITCLMQRAPV